jgi:hypothetical protein
MGFSSRIYSFVALVCVCFVAFFFWRTMFLSAEKSELVKRVAALQSQVDDCATRRESTTSMTNMLRDTDTRPVKLTDGKVYHITIFHNAIRKACALDISGIPVPPDQKYLQCWANVAGKSVSLGMVDMQSPAGWQPLPYTENAEGYEISEEKSPQGNSTPTMVMAAGVLGSNE